MTLERRAAGVYQSLRVGSEVALPSFDDQPQSGVIQLRVEENNWLRFGGKLSNGSGTFSLHIRAGEMHGSCRFPETGQAWEIVTEPDGRILLVERRLSQMICWPPSPRDSVAAAEVAKATGTTTGFKTVPQINTRAGAKGVIYLHFSGGSISDVDWNGGVAVEAAPSNLSSDDIREVVARVAEDYAPFDIAVSTVLSDYEKAQPGKRMRVIITPTNTLLADSGGLSLVGCWSGSGKTYSSTVPAWVFNSSTKAIAEAASHEVGHTLGLSHDGTKSEAYYLGNGGDLKVATSWAPIMGTSYYRSLTQWSKGEYPNANNTEDDLAVIASDTNGFGYAVDLPGDDFDSTQGLQLLRTVGGTFTATGTLRYADVPKLFCFNTTGGSFSVSAKPAYAKVANADIELNLIDASGRKVLRSNPTDTLSAAISSDFLAAGSYAIAVRASASSDPDPSSDEIPRYTAYGSLGAFALSGTIQNAVPMPEVLSSLDVCGTLGRSFSHRLILSEGASITQVSGALPPGIDWDAQARTFSGTPSNSGTYPVTLTVSGDSGKLTWTLNMRMDDVSLPLPTVEGEKTPVSTSSLAPWVGQLATLPGGLQGVAAVSGRIPNSALTRMRLRLPANRSVSFWWKTSSEAGHDFLECRINGVIAKNADTGAVLRTSGTTDWTKQRVYLTGSSYAFLEFIYAKDSTLTQGGDRAWVCGIEVGTLPTFTSHPASKRLLPSQTDFTLACSVTNAGEYQWTKDGVDLVDGTSDTTSVTGANTATLYVSGVKPQASGAYRLKAKNSFGTVLSRSAVVAVPLPPVIIQFPVPSTALVVGDTLSLSPKVGGALPISATWWKDGCFLVRQNATTLQFPALKLTDSGTYTLRVTNAFGTSDAASVSVQVNAASARLSSE